MFGMERHRIRTVIPSILPRLGYPSIREIQSASCMSPQLVRVRGISYHTLYSELNALVVMGHVSRIAAHSGHRLRFCADPISIIPSLRILRPIPTQTICDCCGSPSILYRGKMCRIRGQSNCAVCNPQGDELSILDDPCFGLKFVLDDLAILGVVDYFGLRLPGSIRGYGTEYQRAIDLLSRRTGKKHLLAVIGHLG